jgi:hypothetical protein
MGIGNKLTCSPGITIEITERYKEKYHIDINIMSEFLYWASTQGYTLTTKHISGANYMYFVDHSVRIAGKVGSHSNPFSYERNLSAKEVYDEYIEHRIQEDIK